MILKKFSDAYRYCRLISKHKSIVLLHTNNVKRCSITNKKKKEYTFNGPSLKDFIAKDLPQAQTELINNGDKIPYVDDTVDLGENRKGKSLLKASTYLVEIQNVRLYSFL